MAHPTDHPPLLLLDTASLYFRAFFGVKNPQSAPDGTPTNALRGLLDMVATLVRRFEPDRIAACWDEDWRPAFRVEAIPSYKAHRLADPTDPGSGEDTPENLSAQVPLIRTALQAVGIPVVGAAGYEADDVIGTLVAAHRGRSNGPIGVVTGDRDLFQLVDDEAGVSVIYTAKAGVRDAEVITERDLQDRYGVATGPAYAEMAVLRGDTSDGLPGVKGIGEKTAAQLITEFGSLAAIRAAVDGGDDRIAGAKRRNLEAATAYLDAAPAVVQVAADAPVGAVDLALPREVADPAVLEQLIDSYPIEGSVGRLLDALGLSVSPG